jgi:hypothetical protein
VIIFTAMLCTSASSGTQKAIPSFLGNAPLIWCEEFLIALEYFSTDHLSRNSFVESKWMRSQIYKEWYGSGVYGESGHNIQRTISQIAQTLHYPSNALDANTCDDLLNTLRFVVDELSHFVLLLRLYEQRVNTDLSDSHLWGDYPEGRALTEERNRIRSLKHGREIVYLSEGGGLGLFFGIKHCLTNQSKDRSPFDKQLLSITNLILEDEIRHLGETVKHVKSLHLSDHETIQIQCNLEAISKLKVNERRYQFEIPNEHSYKNSKLRHAWSVYESRYLPMILDYH